MSCRTLVTLGALYLGTTLAIARKPPAEKPAANGNGAESARAIIKTADGKDIGEVLLQETRHGVLITAHLEKLPAGPHAFHIHETGKCEASFKSAGEHFNPDGVKHGILNQRGKHAGDLPNIHVPDSGKVSFEVLAPGVTLKAGQKKSLLDADGSAIVIHAQGDDNVADPAGNAGDRIACGVISK